MAEYIEKTQLIEKLKHRVSTDDDSIVSIFWENKPQTSGRVGFIEGVRTFPGDNMSLEDCYNIAVWNGYKKGVITVCRESPLHGEIYKYGNHGSFWEKVGETDGYA